jgi:biopolymer transport protein ExbD
MAKKKSKRQSDEAALDMTPMIDVVFQLIIFFVVTLKTAESVNPDIELADAPKGPEFKQDEYKSNAPVVIEIMTYENKLTDFFKGTPCCPAMKGCCISINGARVDHAQLKAILKQIISRRGTDIPIMFRADKNTKHEHLRHLMTLCAELRLWKFSFLAMKEKGGK